MVTGGGGDSDGGAKASDLASPQATVSSSGLSVGDSLALLPTNGSTGGGGGGVENGSSGSTTVNGQAKGLAALRGADESGVSSSGGGGVATTMGFSHPQTRKVLLGLLVFQYIMIGLILALLPTPGGTATQRLEELLLEGSWLALFVVLSLILSEFLLPGSIDRLDRCGSQEVFTLCDVVLAFALVGRAMYSGRSGRGEEGRARREMTKNAALRYQAWSSEVEHRACMAFSALIRMSCLMAIRCLSLICSNTATSALDRGPSRPPRMQRRKMTPSAAGKFDSSACHT